MALALDFLQHVVNVHWGGTPIFIVLTNKGEVYRANFLDEIPTLQLVSLPVTPFFLVGGDYAKVNGTPTFVIAGSELIDDTSGMLPAGVLTGFICTSLDGKSWMQSFQTPQGAEPIGGPDFLPWVGTLSAIVYSPDRKMFAASGEVMRLGQPVTEEIYTSSNGGGWSISTSINIGGLEEVRTNASTFPGDYCLHNGDCIDDLNHSVPGGIMQHDKNSETQMQPSNPPTIYYWNMNIPRTIDYHTLPLQTFSGFDEPIGKLPSPSVVVNSVPVNIPGIAIATCVAGKGSVWLAGGFVDTDADSAGAVAVTLDSGETWNPFGSTTSGVVAIVAGEV